jgi:hypothetical protein
VKIMDNGNVTVRAFGLLRGACDELGLPATLTAEVPEDGVTARELARRLGFEPSAIEGVFVNHTMYALSHVVLPGDRVGYVPYGTPGPHRVYLGIYEAGRADEES